MNCDESDGVYVSLWVISLGIKWMYITIITTLPQTFLFMICLFIYFTYLFILLSLNLFLTLFTVENGFTDDGILFAPMSRD